MKLIMLEPLRIAFSTKTVLGGDFYEAVIPDVILTDQLLELQSCVDCNKNLWSVPFITHSVGTNIRITNFSNEPILVKKGMHIAQVRPVWNERLAAPLNIYNVTGKEGNLGVE